MLTTDADTSPLPLPTALLKSNGRWISDSYGRVYVFHGVSMVNKLPPYTLSATGFDERSARLLADNGLNVVRVGLIYSAVEPAPGVYDDEYLRDILKTVEMLADHGIMSLIDFHQDGWGPSFRCEGFPEWATFTDDHPIRPVSNFPLLYEDPAVKAAWDNLWNNIEPPGIAPLQDGYGAAWAHAAGVLMRAKNPNCILGWEVMNEPNSGSGHQDPPNGALTRLTQNAVGAIRTVDTDHMIWYEPWVSFDLGTPTLIGPITDPGPVRRIGFAFHNYQVIEKYDEVWTNAENHSKATGDALLATEFGAKTTASEIEAVMQSVDSVMMSAIYWTYSNRTPYKIEVLGVPVSSADQGLVYDPSRELIPGNVWEEKLTAVVRPYPLSIAGTPQEWAFSPSTWTFNLTYEPGTYAEPTGNTYIFVPNLRYPKGATVEVSGGTAFPDPNPQVLRIKNSGPGTVTVKITPKPS
jgi:endoglycosylceramidase